MLPPNFETYPFSDAERYSLDSIRIINGITSNFIISKPFHAIYLAILNYLGHLDYQNVILGQTLILAFFPSVLFLIGKEIRGNILGLGLGIFAIFREINAIQASNVANVANSKLLLSDFPSTLILSVIILLMLQWIKKPQGKLLSNNSRGHPWDLDPLSGAIFDLYPNFYWHCFSALLERSEKNYSFQRNFPFMPERDCLAFAFQELFHFGFVLV